MKTYKNIYPQIYSYSNLEQAFVKSRKRKTLKSYVISFESNLEQNLLSLQKELKDLSYKPKPLSLFIIKDPKTRKISASDFRDRIVHHALCNIIEPILSKEFIFDSFANQKLKGTHKAVLRFEKFMRRNIGGYVLKCDVKHYFDTVDHRILLKIIGNKIKDEKVLLLIKNIIDNHQAEVSGKGMPIGNLTSQFFANVYLNKLDQFIKHKLRARYYIRYVDDFVMLSKDKIQLQLWKEQIAEFLKSNLSLELHPDKSIIYKISAGTTFLGFRIFEHYRLLKKSNARRIFKRIIKLKQKLLLNRITITELFLSLKGWLVYASFANTYKLQRRVTALINSEWR